MNGAAEKFLPRAALPLNQYGAPALSHFGQNRENLPHCRRLGNNILEAILAVDFLAQRLYETQVAKCLDAADYPAGLVLQQSRADADRDFFAIGPKNHNRFIYDGLFGLHCGFKDAGGFADVGPEDFTAWAANRLRCGNARNFLRCTIEKRDPPLGVYSEYPVCNAVQNNFSLRR